VHSISVFYRFIDTIVTQIKSLGLPAKDVTDAIAKGQRLALLNVFESFLESAPQLLLQLYILSVTGMDTGTHKGETY